MTEQDPLQPCPCGSGKAFVACCGPIISGEQPAATAEALMRSRYSAYVIGEVTYLGQTLHPNHRADWDEAATARWAEGSQWLGLEILATEAGGEGDEEGWVEFAASYREEGVHKRHQENSRFQRHAGVWHYVDGELPKPQTQRNEGAKVGRNDPCSCGSGKKFKKCCGR